MGRYRLALAACAAALTLAAHAGPTAICNPDPRLNAVILDFPDVTNPLLLDIIRAVQVPASNRPLYDRLRQPTSIKELAGSRTLILYYDPIQDLDEIAQSMRNDVQISSAFTRILRDQFACDDPMMAPRPTPELLKIVEFHHTAQDIYFISALPAEIEWIDGGGAGGGWRRTGQAWFTYATTPGCADPEYNPVYRFFGTPGLGPANTHFYTARPDECGWLRNTQGWSYLTVAFGAKRPLVDIGCPADAPVAVRRLYNNRAAQNRSNHRYTSSDAIYAEMLAKGWLGEGVQFCVKNTALGF
ncbi:hypothetical protein [Usitatibacter palustris]|uniref:DUF5648 domain-containing protein n=1 Tax=Usitatibacter palustris TaxID=2732487 RepID=A0A6M4HD66_9PROT|nr:hypothetical protein [Usitatibacter palustris]QJR15937.1 hypothetical protein DSM104440_02764 [Usitatibacter palustris]